MTFSASAKVYIAVFKTHRAGNMTLSASAKGHIPSFKSHRASAMNRNDPQISRLQASRPRRQPRTARFIGTTVIGSPRTIRRGAGRPGVECGTGKSESSSEQLVASHCPAGPSTPAGTRCLRDRSVGSGGGLLSIDPTSSSGNVARTCQPLKVARTGSCRSIRPGTPIS
jgi:hypothetical protein